jgi:chemotaxis methyl-accepting protein methylase/PAS domain-containing protein
MKNRANSRRARRRPLKKASGRLLSPTAARRPFAIVGIGASAGGLEALAQFLGNVQADSGLAFVVIQHLDPTLKGMMPELLQRTTAMKVVQVKDGLPVRPGCVYVIPPNKDMSILHGKLHLLEPVAPRGLRLPIDFFFRSLAEDQREFGVGVILSGMGSDGTLGLKAIKENGGVVMVQEPASAKFDAMPSSAIGAGLADFVAPAEELSSKLVDYLHHVPRMGRIEAPMEEKMMSALDKVIILLRSNTGQDFTHYRRNTLYRRVERRMGIHQISKISTYVRFLQENPQELGILFKELLIGVTSFFRDSPAWDQLKKALPALLARRPAGSAMRAWIAGCSTGEEAYSLAMLFREALSRAKSKRNLSLQIYATDIDRDAIAKARQGLYPPNIVADVSPARLSRFFVKEESGYRVNKEIRAMVVFAPQNLIMDPPFNKLDIFCCRNLLIYLTPELQKRLIPLFHYILNPDGLLFLGSSESIGGFTSLFTTVAAKERVFRRRESRALGVQQDFPTVFTPVSGYRSKEPAEPYRPAASVQMLADQMLKSRYAPPAVLVNEQGDIVYVSGRTGKYLEPAAGKANWNIIAMAREGLRYDLTSALQKVVRTKGSVTVHAFKSGEGHDAQAVDILVQAVQEPKELTGMVLFVFTDTAAHGGAPAYEGAGRPPERTTRRRSLEWELRHARGELKTSREEMQNSQEELRAMNEELQSTNEELQSTNEELTTSKEEMQSLNEELQTVNAELQSKLDETTSANNDMKNLLNSTDIATVFLDNEMRVRRFTSQAKVLFKLIPGDVGRPITDLASKLLYPDLESDAQEVLRTLAVSEKSVSTSDGSWFTARIMPYRTLDNRIDGVVITFADITAAKKLEASLREKHDRLEGISARQASAPVAARPLRNGAKLKPGAARARVVRHSLLEKLPRR